MLVTAIAAALSLCSCQKGEELSSTASTEEGLFLKLSVGGYEASSSSTRADSGEETAWSGSTWNETTVSTLYMFIFEEDSSSSDGYKLKYSHKWTSSDSSDSGFLDGTSSYQVMTTAEDGTTEAAAPYYFIEDDDIVYFIANTTIDNYSSASVSDLQALETDSIGTSTYPYGTSSSDDDSSDNTSDDDSSDTTTYLTCRGPQSSFVMSRKMTGAETGLTNDTTDAYGNVTRRTISIELQRCLAKLCLRIKYKGLEETSYSQLSSFSDKYIYLKCENFATKGAVTEDGTYETTAYYTSSTDESGATTLTTSGDLASDGGYYTAGETLYDPDSSSDPRAVFYLYPNCWYDESLYSSLMTTAPIIDSRQTRLSMQITHAYGTVREKTYTYTIPTNPLLPDDNDSQSPDSSFVNLYKIQSNHVYNVTVYVQELETGFSVAVSTSGAIAQLSSGGEETIM